MSRTAPIKPNESYRKAQARSYIITLFGDAILPRGGRIWLGSLIQLLQPLELNERLIRTTVFRLVKMEWLKTETHGRRADYILTPTGRRRFEEASRHIYARNAPVWDHQWRLIQVVGQLTSKQKIKLQKSLAWQGFGSLGANTFIHPTLDPVIAFDTLLAEGFTAILKELMPMSATHAPYHHSANQTDLVKSAWDLAHLAEDYRKFVQHYQPVLQQIRRSKANVDRGQEDLIKRTQLINDYRYLLLRDPELPNELLPSDWPGHKARALCQEIYGRLLTSSEAYLDEKLQWANGHHPRAVGVVNQRFV